jgi:outer membrane protein assembly factor BamB
MAYCGKQGKISVTNSSSLKEVWSSDVQNGSQVIWYDDVLYARNARGQGANYFFTKNGSRLKEFSPEGLRYSIDRFSNKVAGQLVFYAVSDSGVRKIGLLDIKRQEPFWLQDMHVVHSFQTADLVLAVLASAEGSTAVACLSASEGKLLWQLNLRNTLPRPASVYEHESDYRFEITKLIAMYANKLIVGVTWDPATHRFIAIDCSTGQIDQYWSDVAFKTTSHGQQILDGSRVLYLHGYSKFEKETQYVEIDLTAGSIVRTGVVQSLLREGLVLKDWTLSDGKIYFTALRDERFPTHIGILEYTTLDLLWWQKIAIDNNVFLQEGKGPEVDRDHCYVLDTQGTLHFFRKM